MLSVCCVDRHRHRHGLTTWIQYVCSVSLEQTTQTPGAVSQVELVPVHEGPQGAPQHPLPASSRVTVRVEEGHGGASVLGPAGPAAALQPHADPHQEQQQQEGQQQAEVGTGDHQRPQQPEEGQTETVNRDRRQFAAIKLKLAVRLAL